MKSDSIETITAEIKRLLYKENRISINDIMKTIHYPHEMVLIAIGYILFLIASILSHWILMMKDVY